MTHFKQRMSVEITQERLKYLLYYDPDTGIFRWRVSTSNRALVGTIAGVMTRGYCVIGLDKVRYRASNLAWLYVTGEWPTAGIDHKDKDSTNDRWENLRSADQSENNANSEMRNDNTSGYRGVCWISAKNKWRAEIWWKGTHKHVGYFNSPEEAASARDAAAIELHGEFATLNSTLQ